MAGKLTNGHNRVLYRNLLLQRAPSTTLGQNFLACGGTIFTPVLLLLKPYIWPADRPNNKGSAHLRG